MGDTSIQWTDKTWNPVTGCTKVSQGCKNCYAEGVADRFFAKQYPKIQFQNSDSRLDYRPRKFTDVMTHADRLDQPLHWRKPARIFVNSMSDLFHEDVPFEFIDKVFAVMALSPQHTFQILTKRPERMLEYVTSAPKSADRGWDTMSWVTETIRDSSETTDTIAAMWNKPLRNVWLGVSVEDQDNLHRIDTLKDVPAAVRFVSFEPLLENLGAVILDGIHWAIIGGESGPKARPMEIDWVRSVVRQCRKQNVTTFVKQMGGFAIERNDQIADIWYYADGSEMDTEALDADSYRYQGQPVRLKLKHSHGGDWNEWPEDLRVRGFPAVRA